MVLWRPGPAEKSGRSQKSVKGRDLACLAALMKTKAVGFHLKEPYLVIRLLLTWEWGRFFLFHLLVSNL